MTTHAVAKYAIVGTPSRKSAGFSGLGKLPLAIINATSIASGVHATGSSRIQPVRVATADADLVAMAPSAMAARMASRKPIGGAVTISATATAAPIAAHTVAAKARRRVSSA